MLSRLGEGERPGGRKDGNTCASGIYRWPPKPLVCLLMLEYLCAGDVQGQQGAGRSKLWLGDFPSTLVPYSGKLQP